MNKRNGNTRMARPRLVLKGIAVIIVGTAIHQRKKAQGYSQAFRQKAIKMYIDGAGLRRTGRQLGIHHQTVANWAKEEAEKLPETPIPAEVKTAEFDEIFTYIGDKKTESTSLHL
jgi:hypothetical protein